MLQWVSTDFGLTVQWDRDSVVRVLVKPDKQENVCGMCRDFYDNSNNDMTVGPNTEECVSFLTDTNAPPGKQVSTLQ